MMLAPDILTSQQAILRALRDGRSFATAHKEGGTTIHFDGRRFVSADYGESHTIRRFTREAAFLRYLREFYDAQIISEHWPHRIAEAEAWQWIGRRLQAPRQQGGPVATGPRRLGPIMLAALVLACLIAVGLACLK